MSSPVAADRHAGRKIAPTVMQRLRPVGVLALVTMATMLALASCRTPELPVAQSSIVTLETPEPTSTPTAIPTATPTAIAAELPDDEPVVAVPTATPIPVKGVTDNRIRVATIVDVATNGVVDGLYTPVLEGVEAWVEAVNTSGGIAGRELELVAIDSGLFNHAEAITQACEQDVFALIGSKSLFDGVGLEILSSSACGLPDFPAAAQSPQRRSSPQTYVSNPFLNPLMQVGPLRYLATENPDTVEFTAIPQIEFPTTRIAAERMNEAARETGFEVIYNSQFALDEDYGERLEEMAELGVESMLWTGEAGRLVEFLNAVDGEDGVPELILCDASCYSDRFLLGRDLVEGVYVWIPHLPFAESTFTPELVQYQFYSALGTGNGRWASDGVEAWAAGRLFEEAAKRAMGAGTPEFDPSVLTRASLLAAAQTIDAWDANGLYGTVPAASPAAGRPTPCYVLVQVQDSDWERVHPAEEGTFDCRATNLLALLATADFGLVEQTSSTTSDDTESSGPNTKEGPGVDSSDPLESLAEVPNG